MKVSINLAQEFSNVDIKSIPRDEMLKRIGAQLGAVEDVIDWSAKLEGAVVVKVVSCEKHPDADKLSVCQVDDGSGQTTQVVCGAPNVKADMFAVWLKPGVTVPSSRDKDPFVLEAREIRGQMSNGMLASAAELGISDDHDGILDITSEDPKPGDLLTNYLGLDDFVVTCENKMFTHRPDCFGNLGVARELAGINGLKFESPSWYLTPAAQSQEARDNNKELELEVKNEVPELVPRFIAVAMSNVAVGPSPLWLQITLARVGIKSINNVVDASNYVMHLTGQPTHAFDLDKIKERSDKLGIFPRLSNPGEKLKLLGGKEIELTGEEVVISTDKQAVALAGVMGGSETEVDENTKNIIIECATFDMYSTRRTSMRFGLFTDAVTRYNKGQSPLQNNSVLNYLMKLMGELSGAIQSSEVYDLQGIEKRENSREVEVSTEFINSRLGSSLSAEDIKKLLENVELGVEHQDSSLKVAVPFWRMDIEHPEDVVEEVGRLYGYDKLPVSLPPRTSKPTAKNKLLDYKQQLRLALKEAGANEVLTYSFVHGDLMFKTGTDPQQWAYHLRNAISPDLQYYRTSLMPSLMAKVHPNIKAQAGSTDNHFALFEIGKAHITEAKENGLPVQMERLALIVAADDKTVSTQHAGSAYYLAKKYLDKITEGQAVFTPITDTRHPLTAPYQPRRSAMIVVGGEILGAIGEFTPMASQNLKLPQFAAGFELDIEALHKYLQPQKYQPLPEFPVIKQDVTLTATNDKTYAEVLANLGRYMDKASADHGYQWQVEPVDIFQPENDDTRKITFRINLWHPNRTLTTEEAAKTVNGAAELQDTTAERQ